MANFTIFKRAAATGASASDNEVLSMSAVLDFDEVPGTRATIDTFDLMQVPIGALVVSVAREILVADGSATATAAVNIGGVTGLAASTGLDAAVNTVVSANISGRTTTSDVTVTTGVAATTTGKLRITVLYTFPKQGFESLGGGEDAGVIMVAE